MTGPLPDYVRRLGPAESFTFRCHPGVECFTDCCRALDLALSPYDVLRLRKGLAISSGEFLDQYAIIEVDEQDIYPRVYLTMVDDGQASCPLVSAAGCTVYQDRPGACRTYPLGRGASRNNGKVEDFYVLLTEPHCLGFDEQTQQDTDAWLADQEIGEYNRMNDLLMPLLQHKRLKEGFMPSARQREEYINTLYDLDRFRAQLLDPASQLPHPPIENDKNRLIDDDTALLEFAILWLQKEQFHE